VRQGRSVSPARVLSAFAATLLAFFLVLLQGIGPARADGSLSPAAPPPASGASNTASSAPDTGSSSSSDTNTSSATGTNPGSTPAAPTSADPGGNTSTAGNPGATQTPAGVAVSTATGGIVPSASTVSSGISVVTGGDPTIPSVTNQPMPSTTALRQAISAFLSGVVGAALPGSVGSLAGQPALYDLSGDQTATQCRCTVALAISIGSSASAVAIPGAGPAAALPTAHAASVGGDVSDAEIAGSTGNATSVSLSGNGPASATATAGNSGIPSGAGPSIGHRVSFGDVQLDAGAFATITTGFSSDLLTDVGPAASTLSLVPCATLCGAPTAASVDVEAYVPNGTTCAPGSASAEWCTIAIAISLGGHAHAVVASPATAAVADCSKGQVGRPTAIAIGVKGPASAVAHMGSGGGTCATGLAPLGTTTAPVKASSGSTGDSLAIGIAQQGPAGANATSGNSGQVRAITDGSGNGLLASSATATTGNTGDAVGISIGKTAASALVRSGSSGRAAALCTRCSLAGGNTIAEATSGRTGGSYSLAVAGKESFTNAVSGDSGDAASWAVHGTAETFLTGQDTQPTPDSVVKTGDVGQVYVAGRSGDTGNVVATATDLLTWVSVLTHSGNAGPVISTAKWDADGCTLIFATFTMQCSATAAPEPVGGSGSQKAPDPVVSAPEPGAVMIERGTKTASAPASAPVAPAGQPISAPSTKSGSRTVGTGTGQSSGQGTDGNGGARTRLVSNEVASPGVSTPAFSPLTSWWGLLTLCMFATLLVALVFIACRYGRPRNMNTG
jgi:hypothetical protein